MWKVDHRGYGIVPSVSWSVLRLFAADFTITRLGANGDEIVYQRFCPGTFQTEGEARDAAVAAARAYIETLVAQ